MQKRNMASFAVTPNIIEDALAFPAGHHIVGATWDFASQTVRLYVEGPDLPEVEPGQIVGSIFPTVTKSINDDGKEKYIWTWNTGNGNTQAE